MKNKRIDVAHACLGIPVETTLRGTPGVRLLADVRYRGDASLEVHCDDAVWAVDWPYLAERIRRVAAVCEHGTLEALAWELAGVVLADAKTGVVEVALRRVVPCAPGVDAESSTAVRRVRDASLSPPAPAAHVRAAVRARAAGALVKAAATPFHALFPKKRWIMPAVDPARCPPLSDTPIPRLFWQTNFTDRCSLPVWANYRRNRRLSADFEHRYVGTEERAEYMREHASPRVAAAYARLTDGAAQADLWRLVALYEEGGVYLDIDAALVRPLSEILAGRDAVYLWDRRRFSNYFLATVPKNPVFAAFIDTVVDRIERHAERRERTVFYVTGPGALEAVTDVRPGLPFLPHRSVALQGVFTNERFQYIDRPRSKWTYKRTFMDDMPA